MLVHLLIRCWDRHWKISRKHPKTFTREEDDDEVDADQKEGGDPQSQPVENQNVSIFKKIKFMIKPPPLERKLKSDVNTRMTTQNSLEQLYTGFEMKSHFVYSHILVNFFSCLTFSAGLPLLYIIGFCFSVGLYWVYKTLLLKYYRKTTSFNQALALQAIDIMQVSVMFHVLIGSFIFSNSAIFGTSTDIQDNFFYRYIKNNYKGVVNRFQSHHSIFYFGLCFLLVLIYVGTMLGIRIIRILLAIIRSTKAGMGQVVDSDGVEEVSDFYKDMTLQQLQ